MRRPFLFLLLVLPLCLSLAPRRPLIPGPEARSDEPHWLMGGPVPSHDRFDGIARSDPVGMIEAGLARYGAEVAGYRCVLVKRERVGGRLKDEEEIAASFRERPFSVLMRWVRGADAADASLYVADENDGEMLVRPTGWRRRLLIDGYASLPVDDERAREASRFGIDQFGIAHGMMRTHQAWSRAEKAGRLHAEYLGLRAVPEADGQLCHVWERRCDPPEEDGLTRVRVAIDARTWLQVNSELWAGDELIAYYRFRELELNPSFDPAEFCPETLNQD